ncbi:transcriptional repressor [Streptomyces sp. NPDC051243]|uniref:transcriptional repressor n=1 Tax=Streptomyces sp. NPDC051243 TaxID=3365646 RepID=UPI0037B1038C
MSGRTTPQRIAVMGALVGHQDFVSAQELRALLAADSVRIGLTTVYRALHDLEASGGADVVRDDAGERLYRTRPASTSARRHHPPRCGRA